MVGQRLGMSPAARIAGSPGMCQSRYTVIGSVLTVRVSANSDSDSNRPRWWSAPVAAPGRTRTGNSFESGFVGQGGCSVCRVVAEDCGVACPPGRVE